ncbi:hypothetical protein KVV02_003496 [Mortierella alpina]|uniref:RING-type domain-containing protein n=1 Tax=Mortierella alpina TaxID=64518 RepID=A0A9P8A457_MORAP|nr:hypothetical protein KVV02_003496 [Mortierella alpina]
MDKELEVYIELPGNSAQNTGSEPYLGSMIEPQAVLSNRHGCIFGTEELQEILAGREAQLQQKMDEAMDMESFLIELVDTLEAILSARRTGNDGGEPAAYFSQITEQLDTLGWHRVTHMDQDLSKVKIELCDASGRKHQLTVSFPPGYPTVPLIMEPLDIPKSDSDHDQGLADRGYLSTTTSSSSGFQLKSVIQEAEKQLERYREFWDVMQDFDDKTWVIDPEKPTRADRMRRCALGNHCSLQVVVDPLAPRSMPETRLYGPTAIIEPMRTKLHQNAGLWDRRKLPRENLETLLELTNGFPSPASVTKDEMNIECGICYSFRYEGQVPDQLCSHVKCQQPFHRVCLYETITTTAPKT